MRKLSLEFWAIRVLLLLGSILHVSVASFHEYRNETFEKIRSGRYFNGGSEGLYASSEVMGVGMSFIRFDDITFVRNKEAAAKQKGMAGLVETVVFEAKDGDKIGKSFLNGEDVCCTKELSDAGYCSLGELIIRRNPSDPDWPKRIPTRFEDHKEEVKMSQEVLVINKTGYYTVYFMTCDSDLDGIVVRGRSVWKTLGGYLPGETTSLLTFYPFMFAAYFVLMVVWCLQVRWFEEEKILLHDHIALLIGVCEFELLSVMVGFVDLYKAGTSPLVVTLCSVTFTSIKKALAHLLLLYISSGYGLVWPSSGGTGIPLRMFLAGVLYFCITEFFGLAKGFGNTSQDVMKMLLCGALEGFFLQWIFQSLWKTIEKLQLNRRDSDKLQLYKKFRTVLVIMVVLNIVWFYVEAFNSPGELWQVKWIIPAFWDVLFYVLLVIICFFWAPYKNPIRYLYLAEPEYEVMAEAEDLLLAEAGINQD